MTKRAPTTKAGDRQVLGGLAANTRFVDTVNPMNHQIGEIKNFKPREAIFYIKN